MRRSLVVVDDINSVRLQHLIVTVADGHNYYDNFIGSRSRQQFHHLTDYRYI